jgi:hypothetical protein
MKHDGRVTSLRSPMLNGFRIGAATSQAPPRSPRQAGRHEGLHRRFRKTS